MEGLMGKNESLSQIFVPSHLSDPVMSQPN